MQKGTTLFQIMPDDTALAASFALNLSRQAGTQARAVAIAGAGGGPVADSETLAFQ